jgi:hypothetical protein
MVRNERWWFATEDAGEAEALAMISSLSPEDLQEVGITDEHLANGR